MKAIIGPVSDKSTTRQKNQNKITKPLWLAEVATTKQISKIRLISYYTTLVETLDVVSINCSHRLMHLGAVVLQTKSQTDVDHPDQKDVSSRGALTQAVVLTSGLDFEKSRLLRCLFRNFESR